MPNLLITFLCLVFILPAEALAHEIALVQYNADLHFADYAYNRARLTEFAEKAVAHGSKIVVFPEGSLYGYAGTDQVWCGPGDHAEVGANTCRDVREAAESIPSGRSSVYWEAFARKHGVYVLFNIPEAVGSGRYFNTTAAFGPDGYVTRYRKRNLYVIDTYYASEGDLGPVTLTTPYGAFGLLICMDGNFSSNYRDYTAKGVDKIIIPMDWDQDPTSQTRSARVYFQQMARENGADLFVSDVSAWDGTGAYWRTRRVRERNGLPPLAIGVDGISYHGL